MPPPPPPRTVPVATLDQRGTISWWLLGPWQAKITNLHQNGTQTLIANCKMAFWLLSTTFSQNVPDCINKSLTPAHIPQILPVAALDQR